MAATTSTSSTTPGAVADAANNGSVNFDFQPVTTEELNASSTRKNSASYQLIQAFMGSGLYAAKPPAGAIKLGGKTAMSLTQFARAHKIPVKAMNKEGQLILRRLDVQPGEGGRIGEPIPNWQDTADAKPRVRAPRGSKTKGGKPVEAANS